MPKYEVIVEQSEIRSYIWTVEAEDEQDAQERYYDGEVDDGIYIDTIDSEIIDVEEIEN